MKIAIIGAGFTGLSAGYYLTKRGHEVTIFESEGKPGGLALGFEHDDWEWSLEAHYHHWFTNDDSILGLAKETEFEVLTVRPKTSTYLDGEIYQLDSPISLLKFEKLSLIDRIRTGIVLGYLKFTPFWKQLEKITAKEFLIKYMGKNSYKVLWEPLFVKKFGKYANEISASWFWARIKKRTPSLAYPQGGFQRFADHVAKKIKEQGGVIIYNSPIKQVREEDGKLVVETDEGIGHFDYVISTLPSFLFTKTTAGLSDKYKKELLNLKGLGAVNLVISLNEQFLKDGTYWVNINEIDYPFLAVVEHTNFMDKKYYNNEHLLYIGNYLEMENEYFKKSAEELVEIFLPYLKQINPNFSKKQLNNSYVFKAPFAQPIVPLNYSSRVPKMKTPIKNLYLANMQQVYPWDRGTNYAVELGKKAADLIINEKE